MAAGLASESARTLPEASMIVARAPAARLSCAAMSASVWARSVSTRWAKSRVFWVRLRSISVRSEASQALPSITSRVAAVAAMTIRKTARSLKKMRFFTVSSFGDLEAVSGAAHGFKVTRVLGVGLDFFANAADVDVDRARGDVGSVAPDGVKQMVAAEDASFVAGKIIEQSKFGGSGCNGVAADSERHGRRIDFDVAEFHGAGRQRALEAAQHGFDAGDQFTWAEGLGDIVVCAEFETENAVGFAAFCGQKNYGD